MSTPDVMTQELFNEVLDALGDLLNHEVNASHDRGCDCDLCQDVADAASVFIRATRARKAVSL